MDGNGYQPIADYGAIGNLRSVALVGRDGAIDWCCFPYLHRPAVFAAILDRERGGRFRVAAAGAAETQQYVADSNVLVTTSRAGRGRLTLTDLMPLDGNIHGCGESSAPPEIHRLLACTTG